MLVGPEKVGAHVFIQLELSYYWFFLGKGRLIHKDEWRILFEHLSQQLFGLVEVVIVVRPTILAYAVDVAFDACRARNLSKLLLHA